MRWWKLLIGLIAITVGFAGMMMFQPPTLNVYLFENIPSPSLAYWASQLIFIFGIIWLMFCIAFSIVQSDSCGKKRRRKR